MDPKAYPGAYIIGECTNPRCPFSSLEINFFLGIGEFDIAYIKTIAICGGCRQPIDNILKIHFYNC